MNTNSISKLVYRLLSVILLTAFLTTSIVPPSIAQVVMPGMGMNLPVPGTVVNVTPAFNPILMKGVMIHPEDSLKFDFIIDKGSNPLAPEAFNKEANKLIKYFLASLTIPENQMWVNLSPYEKDRIIPNEFGKTEMGRDLLAQDYMLKQLAASLLMPEGDLGRKFWERVHTKAKEKFGTTEVPLETFNKIWIVPENAKVYENEKGAFVVGTHLKVMLEEDYMALEANQNSKEHGLGDVKKEELKPLTKLQTEVLREVIIPEIEKEVNDGETFANLRQIYYSMVLASWYKQALKESLLGKIYVDKAKTDGVNIQDPKEIETIYNQYVETFKKGMAGTIKEEYDASAQEVVSRKYVTGGMKMRMGINPTEVTPAMLSVEASGRDFTMVGARVQEMGNPDQAMMSRKDIIYEVLSIEQGLEAIRNNPIVKMVNSAKPSFGLRIIDKSGWNSDKLDSVFEHLSLVLDADWYFDRSGVLGFDAQGSGFLVPRSRTSGVVSETDADILRRRTEKLLWKRYTDYRTLFKGREFDQSGEQLPVIGLTQERKRALLMAIERISRDINQNEGALGIIMVFEKRKSQRLKVTGEKDSVTQRTINPVLINADQLSQDMFEIIQEIMQEFNLKASYSRGHFYLEKTNILSAVLKRLILDKLIGMHGVIKSLPTVRTSQDRAMTADDYFSGLQRIVDSIDEDTLAKLAAGGTTEEKDFRRGIAIIKGLLDEYQKEQTLTYDQLYALNVRVRDLYQGFPGQTMPSAKIAQAVDEKYGFTKGKELIEQLGKFSEVVFTAPIKYFTQIEAILYSIDDDTFRSIRAKGTDAERRFNSAISQLQEILKNYRGRALKFSELYTVNAQIDNILLGIEPDTVLDFPRDTNTAFLAEDAQAVDQKYGMTKATELLAQLERFKQLEYSLSEAVSLGQALIEGLDRVIVLIDQEDPEILRFMAKSAKDYYRKTREGKKLVFSSEIGYVNALSLIKIIRRELGILKAQKKLNLKNFQRLLEELKDILRSPGTAVRTFEGSELSYQTVRVAKDSYRSKVAEKILNQFRKEMEDIETRVDAAMVNDAIRDLKAHIDTQPAEILSESQLNNGYGLVYAMARQDIEILSWKYGITPMTLEGAEEVQQVLGKILKGSNVKGETQRAPFNQAAVDWLTSNGKRRYLYPITYFQDLYTKLVSVKRLADEEVRNESADTAMAAQTVEQFKASGAFSNAVRKAVANYAKLLAPNSPVSLEGIQLYVNGKYAEQVLLTDTDLFQNGVIEGKYLGELKADDQVFGEKVKLLEAKIEQIVSLFLNELDQKHPEAQFEVQVDRNSIKVEVKESQVAGEETTITAESQGNGKAAISAADAAMVGNKEEIENELKAINNLLNNLSAKRIDQIANHRRSFSRLGINKYDDVPIDGLWVFDPQSPQATFIQNFLTKIRDQKILGKEIAPFQVVSPQSSQFWNATYYGDQGYIVLPEESSYPVYGRDGVETSRHKQIRFKLRGDLVEFAINLQNELFKRHLSLSYALNKMGSNAAMTAQTWPEINDWILSSVRQANLQSQMGIPVDEVEKRFNQSAFERLKNDKQWGTVFTATGEDKTGAKTYISRNIQLTLEGETLKFKVTFKESDQPERTLERALQVSQRVFQDSAMLVGPLAFELPILSERLLALRSSGNDRVFFETALYMFLIDDYKFQNHYFRKKIGGTNDSYFDPQRVTKFLYHLADEDRGAFDSQEEFKKAVEANLRRFIMPALPSVIETRDNLEIINELSSPEFLKALIRLVKEQQLFSAKRVDRAERLQALIDLKNALQKADIARVVTRRGIINDLVLADDDRYRPQRQALVIYLDEISPEAAHRIGVLVSRNFKSVKVQRTHTPEVQKVTRTPFETLYGGYTAPRPVLAFRNRGIAPFALRLTLEALKQDLIEWTNREIAKIRGGRDGAMLVNIQQVVQKAYKLLEDKKKINPKVIVEDQYVGPIQKVDQTGKPKGLIQKGDSVISFNFRRDRTNELTQALAQGKNFEGFPAEDLDLTIVTMMEDEHGFVTGKDHVAFPPVYVPVTTGEYLSKLGKTQFRTAETEKFRHVTRFFNGGYSTDPFLGEERDLIPSPKGITYDQKPEMSAYEVTDRLIKRLQSGNIADSITVNYANPDMVGHTGNFEATVQAIHHVDVNLGRLIEAAKKAGLNILITADHGNADEMLDKKGNVQTKHSTNPVPFIFIPSATAKKIGTPALKQGGGLADVAPSLLHSMGLPQPPEMTGKNLIEGYEFQNGEKTILIVLDGFGINPDRQDPGDAIRIASERNLTPTLDNLFKNELNTTIEASGEAVGLPKGTMGNSEVGHAIMGSGRILESQPLVRVNNAIARETADIEDPDQDGKFSDNQAILNAILNAKKNGTALHLWGLVSNGKIHSSMEHIYKLLEVAKANGLTERVYIHAVLDGRDTPPQSAEQYLTELQSKIDEIGVGEIVSVIGREWAMDRDWNWDKIKIAYDMYVHGISEATWQDAAMLTADELSALQANRATEDQLIDWSSRLETEKDRLQTAIAGLFQGRSDNGGKGNATTLQKQLDTIQSQIGEIDRAWERLADQSANGKDGAMLNYRGMDFRTTEGARYKEALVALRDAARKAGIRNFSSRYNSTKGGMYNVEGIMLWEGRIRSGNKEGKINPEEDPEYMALYRVISDMTVAVGEFKRVFDEDDNGDGTYTFKKIGIAPKKPFDSTTKKVAFEGLQVRILGWVETQLRGRGDDAMAAEEILTYSLIDESSRVFQLLAGYIRNHPGNLNQERGLVAYVLHKGTPVRLVEAAFGVPTISPHLPTPPPTEPITRRGVLYFSSIDIRKGSTVRDVLRVTGLPEEGFIRFGEEEGIITKDSAQTATNGGIDLNRASMNMQIERDGKGVPLPVNLQNLENLNIQGFQPIIINVVPITNLPLLLGLKTESDKPVESSQESLSVADRLARNPS